jgi:hypothetical protein
MIQRRHADNTATDHNNAGMGFHGSGLGSEDEMAATFNVTRLPSTVNHREPQ